MNIFNRFRRQDLRAKEKTPPPDRTDTPGAPLKPWSLDDMIYDTAKLSEEPEEVVTLIVNLFMDSFVEELSAGRKLRLDEHGTFRGSVDKNGALRIKHNAPADPLS